MPHTTPNFHPEEPNLPSLIEWSIPTIELSTRPSEDGTSRQLGARAALPPDSKLALWGGPDFSRRTGIDGTFSIERENDFELTMTDEVRERVKEYGGMARVREDFEELIAKLLTDPHGETNIDHFKDTDAGRLVRHVHQVTGPLARLMGDTPLALKATGLDVEAAQQMRLGRRTGLRDQFRSTLFVRRQFEKASPDAMIDDTIGVADIYGVVSYRNPEDGKLQEWMLMEHIKDAQPMTNARIALAVLGCGPSVALGFERAEYPELATFYDKHDSPWGGGYRRDLIEYSDLANYLYEELGIDKYSGVLDDLNGNNILVREETDGSKKYFIIDVQSH